MPDRPRSVYFFGDSICFGQFVSVDRVWTTQVSRYLTNTAEFSDVLTQVTAVNGETSREALARIGHCVTSHRPELVWVQFGLNDANFWASDEGLPRVTMESYVSNMLEIIHRCLCTGSKKVIVGINHRVTKSLAHLREKNTYADNATSYNHALRSALSALPDHQVLMCDMENVLESKFSNASGCLLPDGVHLNQLGHDAYASEAIPLIAQALRIIA